ncbi:hypothetical protein DW114_13150 [Absiella sp. AM09-50]|nr:hypothetical protein DW271_01375 [Absiella sp. AM22-9]RGB63258.1 hypothetical protein DW120_00415 [Absiella sp. AM10-20]RGB65128.1 hypothetical protein DW113_13260 [Absiella sp. AM09-45]RGB74659.1 hypothetical protein DW114_13150 [Absiella sp. AM09-50]RHU06828.1 hypothetical protein DW716_10190 [Absiella sp. AM27-20]
MMFTFTYLMKNMLYYEVKKIFSRRYHIVFLLGIIIVANVLFFYQNKSDSFNASDYKQIQIKLKGKTDKERYAYLNELQDINSLFMMKEAVINHQVDFNEYVEKYGKEWVNQVLKMEYEDIVNDALIHRLIEEEDNLHSYDLFLKQVKQQYETNQSISIFQNKDPFIQSRADQTKRLYEKMHVNMPSSSDGSYGSEKVLKSMIPDALILLTVAYFFYMLVAFEDEKGMIKYGSMMKKGSNQQLLSKWLALLVLVMGLEAIFLLTLFLNSGMQYGMQDIFQPIQSILYYVSVPYHMNVLSFIAVVFCFKIIIYAFLLALLFMVYAFVKNYLLAISISALFIGSFTFLASTSGDSHLLSYLGLTQILHPEYALKNVSYIRFFSMAIPYNVLYGLFIILMILAFALCFKLFHKQRKHILRITHQAKSHKVHGLLFYEMKKLWINDFGIVLMVVCLIAQILLLALIISMSNIEDNQYNYYIDQIGDHVSKEADEKIALERQKIDDAKQQIMIEKDPIKLNEYMKIQSMEQGFSLYENRYQAIKEDPFSRKLIKEDQVRFLIDNDYTQSQLLFVLLLFMILITMQSYDRENLTKVKQLQNMSEHMDTRLKKAKLITMGIGAFIGVLGMNFMMLLHNYQMYPGADYTNRLCDSVVFYNTHVTLSIGLYLVLLFIWQLFITCILMLVLQKVYHKIPHAKMITIILLTMIFPLLMKDTSLGVFAIFYDLYYPITNFIMAGIVLIGCVGVYIGFHVVERRKRL